MELIKGSPLFSKGYWHHRNQMLDRPIQNQEFTSKEIKSFVKQIASALAYRNIDS